MKIVKRLFLAFGVLLVTLIGAAVAVPFFFKDKIIAQIKTEANKQLNAKMDFKDVSISVFRSFPNVSVGLDNFSVTGNAPFAGIKLIEVERFDVSFDIMSIIRGDKPMNIKRVWLTKPNIYVRVLPDGTANYNITKPDTSKTAAQKAEPSAFALKLSSYGVTDGNMIYEDDKRGASVQTTHLDHEGSGDFTANTYDLITKTTIKELTTKYGTVTYLSKADVSADLTIGIDNANSKYTFKDNNIKVNALDLDFGGWLAMKKDMDMDLKFKSKSTDFKSLLSLVPAAYTKDYDKVQASGKAAFDGFVKGVYNDNSYPSLGLNIKAENGKFKYPSLPMGMDDINASIGIKSPNKDFDNLTVDVPKFHVRLGANPFDATLYLRTPMSDPDIKSTVKGVINLAELSKAFPVEGLRGGIIKADVACNTRLSYVTSAQYEKVDMKGDATVTDLSYTMKGYPPIFIKTMEAIFSPTNVKIPSFNGILGKSDLIASGTLDNPLAYFSGTKTVKGDFKMRSNNFDCNEWLGGDSKDKKAENHAAQTTSTPAAASKPFDRFDITFDGVMGALKYSTYNLKDIAAKGHVTPNSFKCDNFQTLVGNSDIQVAGEITNIFGYLYGKDVLKGVINFKSRFFDLNQFMTKDDKTPAAKPQNVPVDTANLEPIFIPANIDMVINAAVGTMPYDRMVLKNAKGQVIVHDQKASVKDFYADALGGSMLISGTYDSKVTNKRPKFDFSYKLNSMDFQQVFQQVSTVQKYAPIAQYIDGKFSTTMNMAGLLKPDLMPDFNTLTGLGDLLTINGVLRNFKPLDDLANQLNVKELREARIVNTKNFFEMKNGRFEVKPFDVKMKDAVVNVGGSHGIATDMDYLLQFTVPRALLDKVGAGQATAKGMDLLNQQAAKIGLSGLKQSETLHFNAKMTGTMMKPKIAIQLVSAEGKNMKDAVVDKLKDEVKAKVDDAKKQGEAAVKSTVDDAKKRADELAADAKRQAKEAADKAVKDAMAGKINADSVKKAGQKAIDDIKGKGGNSGQDAIDKAKKAADDLLKNNPFKKKN